MQPLMSPPFQRKVRLLTKTCLFFWLIVTVAPALMARSGLHIGPWPLDFWVAAQGSVLGYLLIVVVYAGLVNRWERLAGALSFSIPSAHDA